MQIGNLLHYYSLLCLHILFYVLPQINLGIYIQDEQTELSVLVDRSVGGSSIVDGQIELMLHRYVLACAIHNFVIGYIVVSKNFMNFLNHNWESSTCRRLLHDDSRGVAEALNETVCIHDKCSGLTVSTLLFHFRNLAWRESFSFWYLIDYFWQSNSLNLLLALQIVIVLLVLCI